MEQPLRPTVLIAQLLGCSSAWQGCGRGGAGAPSGIRTRDLHLERVASWAARLWGHPLPAPAPRARAARRGAPRVGGGQQLLSDDAAVLAVAVQSHEAADLGWFSLRWHGDLQAADRPAFIVALLEDAFEVDGGLVVRLSEDDDALRDGFPVVCYGLYAGQRSLLDRSVTNVDFGVRGDGKLLPADDPLPRRLLSA